MRWEGAEQPAHAPPGPGGWLRVVLRALPLAILVFGCLVLLLLIRLVERPFHGARRPWTPHITQFVCRSAFRILGMTRRSVGVPMAGPGAVVANHVSWLDIFALNAGQRVTFVSKSEVAGWPGIGWLARATGTLFIDRDRRAAGRQVDMIRERIGTGELLCFFPEGTSTDGLQVLPFRTTLFAAFFAPGLDSLTIQPVTLSYTAPDGEDARFYGWWGDASFGAHLVTTLAARSPGAVTLTYHPPLAIGEAVSRKTLAADLESAVRAGLSAPR